MSGKKKAFTLLELLVVIAIIGILTSVVLVKLSDSRQKARAVQQKADITHLSKLVQAYYSSEGVFPSNKCSGCWCVIGTDQQGLGVCLGELQSTNLIQSFPTPPSGRTYYYYNSGSYALLATILPTLEYGPGPNGYRCSDAGGGIVTDKRYCVNIFR